MLEADKICRVYMDIPELLRFLLYYLENGGYMIQTD